MPDLRKILITLRPAIRKVVNNDAALKLARETIDTSVQKIVNDLKISHPHEWKIIESEALKLASETPAMQSNKKSNLRKIADQLTHDFFVEIAKEEALNAAESFSLDDPSQLTKRFFEACGARLPRYLASTAPKTLNNLNDRLENEPINSTTSNIRTQLAAIRNIDPNIIDDLNSFVKEKITQLSADLIITATDPSAINALSKEIDELTVDSKRLFAAVNDPLEFCKIGAAMLTKIKKYEQQKSGYDLSKERASHLFREITPQIAKADALAQRLTIIKNRLS